MNSVMTSQWLLLMLLSAPAVWAADRGYNASLSAGLMSSQNGEWVYEGDSGRKLSELRWKASAVTVIKGHFSADLQRRLTFNAGGWITPSSGSARMDDYDWTDKNSREWTRHSYHDDTRLHSASLWDLSLSGWLLREEHYRVGGLVGYQQSRYSWTAYGGAYRYGNGREGNFPQGERIIGYRQTWSQPYIGLTGYYRYQNVDLTTTLKYSRWVRVKDNDEHYRRNQSFRDTATNGRYYSANVEIGYFLFPDLRWVTGISLEKFKEAKGTTEVIFWESGESINSNAKTAGMSARTIVGYTGITYSF